MSEPQRSLPPKAHGFRATSTCGIESAARLLIHARNNHGSLRSLIRAAIHADILILKGLHHG